LGRWLWTRTICKSTVRVWRRTPSLCRSVDLGWRNFGPILVETDCQVVRGVASEEKTQVRGGTWGTRPSKRQAAGQAERPEVSSSQTDHRGKDRTGSDGPHSLPRGRGGTLWPVA